ncbi:RNB domain-containing ribonuclease [Spirulina major]|uniref:RNB domain-containing ribonuclease n=1 Tax=Spirulina major TaxID=270636 RepID=UPI0009351B3C
MEKGRLVEFRVQGDRKLAVAERPEGKKNWVFIDERGQSHTLKPQRIDYEIAPGYDATEIPAFLDSIQDYLDPSNLEVAWELLVEAGEAVTPADLAQLLYESQEPPVCYAAHMLLADDRLYFKKKGEVYEPRPSSQVEELKHQIAVAAQREQERDAFLARLQAALAAGEVEWQDSDRPRLEALEKYVLYPEQTHKAAQDLLSSLQRPTTPEEAFELLVQVGWWSSHENLSLRRSSYPVQFSQKVIDVAQSRLYSFPPDRDRDRLDLTHLKVYTIDDESTEEIDDGLSVEILPDGRIKLWIHIADPTRFVTLNDELDLEARRRSTTMYLPTGMIPMFPKELAVGPMSLVQGQECGALSFGVILDEVGAIADFSIHASRIKPTYRLTYLDVDEMLELAIQAEPEITALNEAAQLRRLWRRSQGSIEIRMPEPSIKVKSEEDISIEVLYEARSRQLVAEMMILAGEVTGRFAQANNIPVPFRGQPQPELPPDEELMKLPAGPVRYCAMRRCMPRSEMGITPAPHAGLGLPVYTQATSPIRRYTDLLTHFQIKAFLRGETPPLPPDQLQAIIFSVTASAQEAILVERQTNRYWTLEYLRRNADTVWEVQLLRWLREDEQLGLILLEDLGLELPHRFNRSIALGDRLGVQVSAADPRHDVIRFREMVSSEATATAS